MRALYRVSGHRYVAGFEADENGTIVRAAPIIKWMLGFKITSLRLSYGYKIERLFLPSISDSNSDNNSLPNNSSD